jgi:formylglycine-generating enzyme required for sulfatase activity
MSPSTLLQSLLGSLLDSPAVVEIATQAGGKALSLIREHFTYSAYEISQAYQDSYGYALGSIRVGLAAPDKFFAFTDEIFQSKITREFSVQIEKHYFQPFAEKRDRKSDDFSTLRKQLVENIKDLSKRAESFQFEKVTEEDLAALINYQGTIAITDLVIEQISPVDDTVADFLRYDGLLGNALVFFFREGIRRDERLKTTQEMLQREGLCVAVQDIQNELEAVEVRIIEAVKKKSSSLELAQRQDQLIQVETAWQTRHAQLIQFNQRFENQLGELLAWAEDVDATLKGIEIGVKGNKILLEEILEKVTEVIARQEVSAQIKPRDEFTHYSSSSQRFILEMFSQLKQLSPKTPQYYRASILVGSALSSTGDLKRAARLFQQTIDNTQNPAERALAHFNLFQVQLRDKAYGEALKNLEAAIQIDKEEFESEQYCLHDSHKYPMKRILGAGGMGCVFLCGYSLEENVHVAVKCFWENRKGSRDEIFSEPLLMAKIAGKWVPKPLDYGYFDNAQQARAFFVTEYIEGAIDGEAWLEKEGHLEVKTALPVALQIAQGLQIAHQAGIYHLDLKPANLLLKQTEKGIAVKIIDFGLSQVATSLRDEVAGQKNPSGLTTFGQAIFGTLDYAPPEQQGYTQFGEPSAKSDIFAFGKTLYRLLTGEMPLEVAPETLEHAPNWYQLLYSCTRANPAIRLPSVEILISRLKAIEAASDTKKKEAAELAKRQAEAERLEKRRQLQKEQAELAKRQAEAERLEKRRQLEKVQREEAQYGKRFQFEVVTVNRKGEISHREEKQARCRTEDLGKGITLEMVYIPSGTFTMGSPENEKERMSRESSQHQVTVPAFFMAKYPVTQAQWQAIIGNNPSFFKGENRPVEKVSWEESVEFCQRLTEKTGKTYRLPSEAEWEYACRAGTTTPFYFGETITTDLVNYHGDYPYGSAPKGVYRGKTTDVGSFPPNAFGLYDMHGNVWEWCADHWHENYEGAPTDGSVWKESGDEGLFVLRGGSWGDGAGRARSAGRGGGSRADRDGDLGFRLASLHIHENTYSELLSLRSQRA